VERGDADGVAMTARLGWDRAFAVLGLVVAVLFATRIPTLPIHLGQGGEWVLDGPSAFYFLALSVAVASGALLAWAPGASAFAGRALVLAGLAGAAWGAAASVLDLGVSAVLWSSGWILAAAAVGQGGGPERLEAAVKTQGLGAAAGIALLLAAALLVGLAGTTNLLEAGSLLGTHTDSSVLALSAVRILLAGLALAGAWVPFHYWAPDGLGSATRPAALVLAVAAPLAASLALARTLFAFEPALDVLSVNWRGGIFAVSFLTAAVAGSVALVQKDAARLTAYLTVAQSAEILPSLCGHPGDAGPWITAAAVHTLSMVPLWLALGAWSLAGRTTDFDRLEGQGRAHPMTAVLWLAAMALAAGFPGSARFAWRPLLAGTGGDPVAWTVCLLIAALLPWAATARLARVLFLEGADPAAAPTGARTPASAWGFALCALALALATWLAWSGAHVGRTWGSLLPGG
jgi:formate hydrogenlyase subunit 3/multisubunit Na+/H+ antiporter MnhD subunit